MSHVPRTYVSETMRHVPHTCMSHVPHTNESLFVMSRHSCVGLIHGSFVYVSDIMSHVPHMYVSDTMRHVPHDMTQIPTLPKSTESRNSDFPVSRGTNPD